MNLDLDNECKSEMQNRHHNTLWYYNNFNFGLVLASSTPFFLRLTTLVVAGC